MADNNEIETEEQMSRNNIADLLRTAMMEKDYKEVRRLCGEVPEDLLQINSIYDDTVLHMAAHSKQNDLVLYLLNMIPEDHNHQLSNIKNTDGNTILHEVAADDAMEDAAEELLKRDADLLTASNELGEKPIFCAARYGQSQMFVFLANKMGLEKLSPEESKPHLRRNDGTTVLHVSMATECFGLALFIAQSYPYLIEQRDQSSMTALQYLACNPTAFRKGKTQIRRGFIELLNKSKFEVQKGLAKLLSSIYQSFFEEVLFVEGKKNDRDTLQELVRLLVEKDTSWEVNINSQAMSPGESDKKPEIEECSSKLSQKKGQNSEESSFNKDKDKKSNENALFLATMSNIQEIVQEVLNFRPQALKHTNKEGMNILHVAIVYRHIYIFNMVIEHELLSRRLLSASTDEGNSVLHMVSQKRKSEASEKMQSHALQLRDELLLFEKVKSASKNLITNPLNKDNKTAEELFAAANERLHHDAKEWLMRTTENCTILSVFIATVAFAAVYTVPGGPNQNTGIPILYSKPFFLVFVLADVISLTLALSSVGIFLSILTSAFPLEDFKIYLFKKLIQGIICLVLSVSMMAVAFGAAIVLIMTDSPQNVVWSVVAFLPVPIFFLSYSPLRSAVLGPCLEWFKIFILDFLVVVFVVVVLLCYALVSIIQLFFKALGWTVGGAISTLCRIWIWIWGIFFKSESDTESSQQGEAPLRHSDV